MRLRGRALAWVIALPLLAAGCLSLANPPARPVAVTVVDAETRAPLPGAEVSLYYPFAHPRAPSDSTGTAGVDGVARLHAVRDEDVAIVARVSAPGYLSRDEDLPIAAGRDGQTATIQAFALPRPTVELVVPDKFRGLIRATIRVHNDWPPTPGKRTFPFLVPDSGVVDIAGPRIFRHVTSADFQGRFADGTRLSRTAGEGEVGLRWVWSDGAEMRFMVGNKWEFDEFRRQAEQEHRAAVNDAAKRNKNR